MGTTFGTSPALYKKLQDLVSAMEHVTIPLTPPEVIIVPTPADAARAVLEAINGL